MAKEAVISTEAVNSYGSRVITAGIDTAQYERNRAVVDAPPELGGRGHAYRPHGEHAS